MTITLDSVGKRFGREWILKGLSYEFSSGNAYAILGPNGSGKSTLMQILAGNHSPSMGAVRYIQNGKPVSTEKIFQYLGFCAPYLQLIEELTLNEQLDFHFKFKQPLHKLNTPAIIDLLGLAKDADKQLKNYSSGMKQRVKLALSLLVDVPLILLDEPATNLDEEGINWYKALLHNYLHGRLLIISSNRSEEYEMCNFRLDVLQYK